MVITEWPQVVDAQNVVGVRVGIKHGVDMSNIFADCLRIKVRSGIDQDDFIPELQHDRGAGPAVVRIVGVANSAIAAQSWDAHRRPTAQHGQSRFHLPVVPVAGPGCGGRAIAFVTST